ncbi:MAG: phage tail protein [Azovibrio sp.]
MTTELENMTTAVKNTTVAFKSTTILFKKFNSELSSTNSVMGQFGRSIRNITSQQHQLSRVLINLQANSYSAAVALCVLDHYSYKLSATLQIVNQKLEQNVYSLSLGLQLLVDKLIGINFESIFGGINFHFSPTLQIGPINASLGFNFLSGNKFEFGPGKGGEEKKEEPCSNPCGKVIENYNKNITINGDLIINAQKTVINFSPPEDKGAEDGIMSWLGRFLEAILAGVIANYITDGLTKASKSGAVMTALRTIGGVLLRVVLPAIGRIIFLALAFLLGSTVGLIITSLLVIGTLIYKNWDEIKETASKAWDYITNFISESWDKIKAKSIQLWSNIKIKGSEAWNQVSNFASDKWQQIKSKASEIWESLKTEGPQAWNQVSDLVFEKWQQIKNKASEIWESLKTKGSQAWNQVSDLVFEKWLQIKNKASEIWEGLKTKGSQAWNQVSDLVFEKWQQIKNKASEIWEELKPQALQAWGGVSNFILESWQNIKGVFSGLWDNITSRLSNALTEMGNAITGFSPCDFFKEIFANVMDFFGISMPESFGEFGSNMIGSLIDGLKSEAESVMKFASWLGDGIKDIFGFGSDEDKQKIPEPGKTLASPKSLAKSDYKTTDVFGGGRYATTDTIPANTAISPTLPTRKPGQNMPVSGAGSKEPGFTLNFTPNIRVDGSTPEAIKSQIMAALKMGQQELEQMIKRIMEQQTRRAY